MIFHTLEDCGRTGESHNISKFSAFASDLGWAAGYWPKEFKMAEDKLPEALHFWLKRTEPFYHGEDEDREFGGYVYVADGIQRNSSNMILTVFND